MTALVTRPLTGEIIAPGEGVTVVVAPHPLRHAHHVMTAPAGWSVAEILRLAEAEFDDGRRARGAWHVSIEGEPVPAEWFARVRVKPGKTIVLRARAEGGGSNLLKSLLMLVVAVITAFIAPYLTPILGTLGTSLVVGAITIGANLLLSALFPAKLKDDKGGQTYSISGNQNLLGKYEPVPVILGRLRVAPRYGASAYTEFVGNDQYLRLLFVWGYGPLDIANLKIGDTPLSSYKDVQIEHGYGYPTDSQPTLYPGEVIQQDLSVDVRQMDGWIVRTTSEDITEWAIDLVAPSGLTWSKNKKGVTYNSSVTHQVQYAVAYSNNWISLPNVVMYGNGNEPVRRSVTQKVASGQYDIRIKRVDPDWIGEPKVNLHVSLTAIRSYRQGKPLQFPYPVAWTALKIRASAQLNGVVDNFNGEVTSRVKAWNGANWVANTPSQWPADHFVQVLQSRANARPATNARIDWATLQAWHAYCVREGWKYNASHDQAGGSVFEALTAVASAGRATVVMRDGLWSVAWDDADAPITQHYTPRNSANFSGKRTYSRLPHGLRVKFKNEARGWKDDEILVFRDGYDKYNATLFETVEFQGVTDHVLVWRMGRYHLAQAQLRPEVYTIDVDIEHFINTRGDRVRVTHDAPMFGIVAGRVKAVAGNVVTLDEELLLDPAKAYAVRFRLADGTSLYRTVAQGAGETYDLTLAGSGPLPAVGDLAMFGEAGTETVVLRVKEIRPGDNMTAQLDLVDDAPEILLADKGEIPPFDSQITDPPNPATLQPFNLKLVEDYADASQNYAPTARLTWDVAAGSKAVTFQIGGKPPGNPDFVTNDSVTAPTRSIVWQNLMSGTWSFQVRAVFADGTASNWTQITLNVQGASRPPPDVTGFAVNVLDTAATFSWEPAQSPVAFAEIRYSPATAGAAWASATVLVQRTNGFSAMVPYQAGSYLIKWLTYNGVYSQNATLVVCDGNAISLMNVVEEIFDQSPFLGVMDGVIEENGGLRLINPVPDIEGTYELPQTIDLGDVYTCRVSGDLVAGGIAVNGDFFAAEDFFGQDDFFGVTSDDWQALFYYRSTADDPAAGNWSEWAPFVVGDYTFRAVRFKLGLITNVEGLTPFITIAHATVDMPDLDHVGKDVPVPATGLRINFTPPMRVLKAATVTVQGLATGDYHDITNKDATGFDVIVKNAAGAGVARTIDYIAKGYGKAS